jgi:Subtilase family
MSLSTTKYFVPFIVLLTVANNLTAATDTTGVTLLHQVDPSLQGTGVRAGQVEGDNGAAGEFEVNPSDASVNHPVSLFTWISSSGTANTFPNSVGTDSSHADFVAGIFYGTSHGVAAQVSHVDNYSADYFYNNIVATGLPVSARVVNQSFIFTDQDGTSHLPLAQEQSIDSHYDDCSVQYGVLFVSGAGNSGRVYPAATSYNGIGVGANDGGSSVGPTGDGRCKPDIVAPGGFTSFSTPSVAGSATVLIHAGLRGDSGANTNAASDNRTVKALLLNGAVKPANWTNGPATPLDARYGAGVLNVFNSWQQLKGGQHPFVESTSVTSGNPHPPGANMNNEPALTGWDFNSLTNADSSHDRINHYYFNLSGSNSFTLTATLVWLRPKSPLPGVMAGINDLNLFLYNAANSNLVLSSTSAVDNVEHLFLPTLPPGRYDLQVQKNAGDQVSANETYALAFEFFHLNLSVSESNGNTVITWPLAPDGFQLESTTNLNPPVAWSPVTNTVTVDTNASQNVVVVPATGTTQFFRLQRP